MMLYEILTFLPASVCLFFVLFFLLKRKENGRKAKRILILFFSVAFILYLCHALYFNHFYSPFIDTVYFAAQLSVYPIFLFYLRALTEISDTYSPSSKRFDRLSLLFIIPVTVTIVNIVLYCGMGQGETEAFINKLIYDNIFINSSSFGSGQVILHVINPFLFAFEVFFVFIVGLKMLVHYDRRLQDYYSDSSGRTLTSLKTLLIGFVLFSFFSIIANIVGKSFFVVSSSFLIIPSVLFASLLFYVGYVGASIKFSGEDVLHEMPEEKEESIILTWQFNELKAKIDILLDSDKVFLKHDYKLSDMALDAGTNRSYLSHVINNAYNCNFS